MAAQTVELAGKKFVIVEQREYLWLKQVEQVMKQEAGDVAESKRRLSEPGESIPWEQIKASRTSRVAPRRRRAR